MKWPGGMIKYVGKNQCNIGCICLRIVWKSTVNAKRLPHSLHTLLFEAGSLTDWLCCKSSELWRSTCLGLPSIGITDSCHSACFYMNSGEPFSLHSKYLMEGNNLPSPSLSITRRWDSRQMCPETIILYRIFLANLIFSLNITECIRPMSGHNENSVSFISKFKFMLLYDSLPYNHPAPQEKIAMKKHGPYLYRKSSLTLPSPSLSCS